MSSGTTNDTATGWNEPIAFEAWKHFSRAGGGDKDRMVSIATVLLGLSAAIVAFVLREAKGPNAAVDAKRAVYLALIGIVISATCAVITLIYGAYANWNWGKADQIAADFGWHRLAPWDSPFAEFECAVERPSWLVGMALRQAKPRPPHAQLAPIFWWIFGISLLSLAVHLAILVDHGGLMVATIKDWVTIVGVVIAAISLMYTAYNARLTLRTNRARFWIDLRDRFHRFDAVHLKLRPGGEWTNGEGPQSVEEWGQVEAYMGLFEHCELMMRDGLIDPETFRIVYGYRVANLLANPAISEVKLVENRKGWTTFVSLVDRFRLNERPLGEPSKLAAAKG